MDLHEYQAKDVLGEFGIPSPSFFIASSVEELKRELEKKGWTQAVVKAQIHAGGRGKAGGVRLAKTKEEVIEFAQEMLSRRLVTKQTDSEGAIVKTVMVSQLINIDKEYYASVIVDRKRGLLSLILSKEGGVEIEEIALKSPDAVRSFPIAFSGVIREFQKIDIAKFMGWPIGSPAIRFLQGLIEAFLAKDASMIEINPLVLTKEGEFLALDAKISIDDNALYRQKEMAAYYDPSQLPPQEDEAKKNDLSYVALHGEIGCMVNGAGLAMATMDIIQYFGGKPANFLDVGGSATQEKVAEGFKIILQDKSVKAILVNIFGGIMNCETLALGVVHAAKEIQLRVPLVVRMEGTEQDKGKKVLRESGLNIVVVEDLLSAAEAVTASVRKG